jgi:hypothetical protein
VKLSVTRLYSHWSADDLQLEQLLRSVVAHHYHTDSRTFESSADSRHQSRQEGVLLPAPSEDDSLSRSQLLPLVLDEICRRADMIGIIRYLSDAVGQNAQSVITSGTQLDISALCTQIVEPICHRFDAIASSNRIPGVLQCVVRSLIDTKSPNRPDALLLLAESLVPKIVQWVMSSTGASRMRFDNHHYFDEDDNMSLGEHSTLVDTIQELLKLCFLRLPNTHMGNEIGTSSYSDMASTGSSIRSRSAVPLSLSNHAVLSRSKWLIAR